MSEVTLAVAFFTPLAVLLLVMVVGFIRWLRRKQEPVRLTHAQMEVVFYFMEDATRWPVLLKRLVDSAMANIVWDEYGSVEKIVLKAIKDWVGANYDAMGQAWYGEPGPFSNTSPRPAIQYGAQVWDASEFTRYSERKNGQ